MSRMSGGETIPIRPTNNIYTVLTGVATAVVAVGLILLFLRASALGVSLF